MANYEAGFREAAQHRGHGLSFDTDSGRWVSAFDVEAYLLGSGVRQTTLQRVRQLLVL